MEPNVMNLPANSSDIESIDTPEMELDEETRKSYIESAKSFFSSFGAREWVSRTFLTNWLESYLELLQQTLTEVWNPWMLKKIAGTGFFVKNNVKDILISFFPTRIMIEFDYDTWTEKYKTITSYLFDGENKTETTNLNTGEVILLDSIPDWKYYTDGIYFYLMEFTAKLMKIKEMLDRKAAKEEKKNKNDKS